jgi:signal transduction histidine kinase
MLDNAVKFTRAGTVSLDVRASGGEAGTGLTFVVRDTGIGIPADKLAHIFGDFSQVDESDTRRFGGAGLGLAISWRICKLLGGRIDVTSQAGVGTTFSIALPCLAGPTASTTPAMARP